MLLKLHQHCSGVWGGVHNGKVHRVEPMAIFVRPNTSTHNHSTKRQNQSLLETSIGGH